MPWRAISLFFSFPQRLQHGKALEFGKLRDVQPVVGEQYLDDAVALVVRQTEEVHGGVVHAHQQLYAARLVGLKEVAVNRHLM